MPQYRLPLQSMTSPYFSLMAAMRWLTCSLLTYFTPKLSTTKVEAIGLSCASISQACWHIQSTHGAGYINVGACLLGFPLVGGPKPCITFPGKWNHCECFCLNCIVQQSIVGIMQLAFSYICICPGGQSNRFFYFQAHILGTRGAKNAIPHQFGRG